MQAAAADRKEIEPHRSLTGLTAPDAPADQGLGRQQQVPSGRTLGKS